MPNENNKNASIETISAMIEEQALTKEQLLGVPAPGHGDPRVGE